MTMRALFTSDAAAIAIVAALLSTAQGAGAATTTPAGAVNSVVGAPTVAGANTTTANPIALAAVLRAAPALNANGGLDIRLRWSVKEGWLPNGGFNLYRSDRKTPLNATPLGGTVTLPASLALGGAKPLPLHDLLNQSVTPSGVSLPHPALTLARPPSAASTFNQAASAALQLHAQSASKSMAGSPGSSPTATAPSVVPRLRQIPTAPTPAQLVLGARRTLLLGAALHPSVASALGLSFDDPDVTAGQQYSYELRAITNGSESATIATVTVAVPADTANLKPSAPTGLQAFQHDADSVWLRWQRLDALADAAMGIAGYDVYRVAGAARQKLNKTPVLIMDHADVDADGNATNLEEPVQFFIDTAPPSGAVTYQITVTDIYGRTSEPAHIDLTVQDWHKPQAVSFAQAQLQPALATTVPDRARPFHITQGAPPSESVLIAWTPSADQANGVSYNVYRIDTEQGAEAKQPVRLTSTAVAGTTVQVMTLGPGVIRDMLAARFCLDSQHTASQSSSGNKGSLISLTGRGKGSAAAANNGGAPIGPCAFDRMSASARGAAEKALLGSVQVLAYIDRTAQKDHYYRYYVAAVFNRNNEEATAVQTNVVAYPDLTPPPTPGNLLASFQPSQAGTARMRQQTAGTNMGSTPMGGAVGGGSSGNGAGATSGAGKSSGSAAGNIAGAVGTAGKGAGANNGIGGTLVLAGAAAKRGLTLTNWTGPLTKAAPADMGGRAVITWNASTGAQRYEIYRATATRISSPQRPGLSTPGCSLGSAAQLPPNGTHSGAIATPVCIRAAVMATVIWQANLKDSDFALLGTVTQTEYDDALARSSAQYFVYRVVPVNRWNVPGVMAEVSTRIPATVPPTAPKLVLGTAGTDGGVKVEYLPVSDAGEEVIRYELWRGLIPAVGAGTAVARSRIISQPASGVASKGAANTSTIHVPRFPAGPVSSELAGHAATYGIQAHEPALSAAVRGAVDVHSQLVASMQQGTLVASLSVDPAATSGDAAWLDDPPSALLRWQNGYVYWVRAIDKDNLENDSEPVDVTPLKVSASAPAGVTATWDSTQCAVNVAWQTTDSETAGFLIERALMPTSTAGAARGPNIVTATGQHVNLGIVTAGAAATMLADYVQLSGITQAAAVTYSDSSVFPDNAYLYRVRTLDQAGNQSQPTYLGTAISIPDGCGNTSIHTVQPRSNVPSQPSSSDSIPVVSPTAPSVPKPADEIDIPANKSNPQ